MNAIIVAMGGIFDHAREADCRVMPTATLGFNTGGDRARFEQLLKSKLEPLVGYEATRRRPDHEYELNGIVLKLTVREV